MRPLSLTDTLFYNLRDAQITAVAALDGPCDLPRLIAGIMGATAALPGFSETPVRLGPWWFAKAATPFDICAHVAVAHDPDIRHPADLPPLLDRLRRNRIDVPGAPWRAIVLNPADGRGGRQPLSAVFLQTKHGLADGTRIVHAIGRLDGFTPNATHVALAAEVPTIDLSALPATIGVHDAGPVTVSVPRRGMGRDADASTRLAEAVAAAVEDAGLFPHAHPLRGNVGRTRFVARHAGAGGAGNYIKLETIARRPVAERKAMRIPGLARAQELPLSTWAVALAPPPLARLMMRIWYANFDAIATLIPLPRRLRLGGRAVTAFFAAPPLWGPVPLAALAFADGDAYHLTLFPGAGFTADREALAGKVSGLLNPGMTEPAASPVG